MKGYLSFVKRMESPVCGSLQTNLQYSSETKRNQVGLMSELILSSSLSFRSGHYFVSTNGICNTFTGSFEFFSLPKTLFTVYIHFNGNNFGFQRREKQIISLELEPKRYINDLMTIDDRNMIFKLNKIFFFISSSSQVE